MRSSVDFLLMANFCTQCGMRVDDLAQYCSNCRSPLIPLIEYQTIQTVPRAPLTNWQAMGADKKIPAGICGILLGGFGVHKFILGYTREGIIQLILGFLGVGWIIGVIEGLIYVTKSDEEFVRTYIHGRKAWF